MKKHDEQLDRLFKAAQPAPKPAPSAAMFTLEARVLGGWRGLARNDSEESLIVWFRRAALCGLTLAMLTLLWNFQHPNRSGAELAIAQSAMGMGVEP